MAQDKNITLSDIAKSCGVSKATVSAVLNPRSRSNIGFSEKTEKKVRDAAKELGYRPNRTVRQFFSNRHGSIGLLFQSIYDIPKGTLQYLFKLAKWHDMMLIMEELPADPNDTPKLIAEDCVDGVALFGGVRGKWYESIGEYQTPIVEVNTNRRSGPMCITYDEDKGSKLIIDRLASRGCKKILKSFPPSSSHYSVQSRLQSLNHYAEEAGFEEPVFISPENDTDFQIFQDALAKHPDIDAVVVYNACTALQVYRAADRLGKRVGRDLAVTGYGPTYMGYGLDPSFTMAMINENDISQQVIDMLTAAIENNTYAQEAIVMQYALREGESA